MGTADFSPPCPTRQVPSVLSPPFCLTKRPTLFGIWSHRPTQTAGWKIFTAIVVDCKLCVFVSNRKYEKYGFPHWKQSYKKNANQNGGVIDPSLSESVQIWVAKFTQENNPIAGQTSKEPNIILYLQVYFRVIMVLLSFNIYLYILLLTKINRFSIKF